MLIRHDERRLAAAETFEVVGDVDYKLCAGLNQTSEGGVLF